MTRRAMAVAALASMLAVSPVWAQRGGGRARAGDSAREKAAVWRGSAEIAGKITDETGKGVPDARVTLVFLKANQGFFEKTKKNGEFSARGIQAGEWRVQIEAADFITVRQPLTIGDRRNPPLAVQLKRDNSPELLTKADAFYKDGKNAEARAEYMKVLEAHPELTGINRAVAYTWGREGNHPEALKYLDLALEANPSDSMLLQLAAASAMQVNDVPRSMAYLLKIDEAALDQPSILEDAAVNLINKRRSADAIAVLDRVIARFPSSVDPYFYRGFAKLQAQKTAEGKADLEKFVSLAPPDAPRLRQAKDLLSTLR